AARRMRLSSPLWVLSAIGRLLGGGPFWWCRRWTASGCCSWLVQAALQGVRHRLGGLAVAAVGGHHDSPGLVSMVGLLPFPADQTEADPPGEGVCERGAGEHGCPEEPGDGVEIQAEVVGDLVVGGRGPQQPVEGDPGRTYCCAGRRLARAVGDQM